MNERMRTPPNILLITTDQHRPDAVGWARNPEIRTPSLERLAADGAVFEDAVTVCPVCHPARSSLLTGLYAHQTGEIANHGDLDPSLRTFPEALREAGYRTECVGKGHWIHHTGQTSENFREIQARQREAFGWDFWWEAAGKELVSHHHCDYSEVLRSAGILEDYLEEVSRLRHNGYRGTGHKLDDRWIASEWRWEEALYPDNQVGQQAVDRLERLCAGDQPFCLWSSFLCPHPPYDPPVSYLQAELPHDGCSGILPGRVELEERERQAIGELRRRYRAMIRLVDDWIGRLLEVLDKHGQREQTLVIFTADHGEMMGDHGLFNKNSYYHSSVGIPMAMRGPGVAAGARRSEPVELTDITATILEAAGLEAGTVLSGGTRLPCRSLLEMSANSKAPAVRDHAFAGNQGWRMVQNSQWKYIHRSGPGKPSQWCLFDRQRDPGEQENLAHSQDHAAIAWEMQQRLLEIISNSPAPARYWVGDSQEARD